MGTYTCLAFLLKSQTFQITDSKLMEALKIIDFLDCKKIWKISENSTAPIYCMSLFLGV